MPRPTANDKQKTQNNHRATKNAAVYSDCSTQGAVLPPALLLAPCPVRVKKVPETSAQGLLLVKTRLGVLRCRQLTGTRVTKGGVPGPIWWQKAVLEDLAAGVA